ncbi:dipeptidase PepV [Bacillus sp. 2205SS5-2]|uniref:dipeptidase PepV n=1 Tax=Bacillus sp. 2205SS5-2 TaxID=3109031 RepID=UPI00300411DB
MTTINWMEEVEKRKEDLLADVKSLLQIKSVLDEENATDLAPLGEGVKEALDFMLQLGEKDGFYSKNVQNVAGHLEFGQGDELLGVLCHVDVVPEGDGWSVDPYSGDIKEGKIFARGAIDDKGPTMAAYYAMKIVKDLELPLSKRVRMIIGTDEESDWRCVDTYFQHEEMPSMGFAPDADFPIIYAEKGIADFDVVNQTVSNQLDECPTYELVTFQSGRRYNMVPDFAKAVINIGVDPTVICQSFDDYVKKQKLEGSYYIESGQLFITLKGISAHGSVPNNGKNAGIALAAFLQTFDFDLNGQKYLLAISKWFFQDVNGEKLGVYFEDNITGPLTINVGILQYDKNEGGKMGLNMRYPVTFDLEQSIQKLEAVFISDGYKIINFTDSKPHHVDEKEELIVTLKKVYEEQTGEKAELISIGGGTYARSLAAGVAFGPLFPGREDIAHQKDEYMYIEDLLKATAIYAQAIYELASSN